MAGNNKYVIRYSPGKGVIFVTTNKGDAPVVTLANGQKIVGVRAGTEGTRGVFANSGESDTGGATQYQWILRGMDDMLGVPFTVNHAGQTSGEVSITAGQEVRTDGGGLGALRAAPNKATRGGAGIGATPYGQYGAVPNYLQYPGATLANFNSIGTAPYNFTDPQEYATKYAPFVRDELRKNAALGRELGLQDLNTELEGLATFVPAASGIKRGEVAADNAFNQEQRSAQVEATLPGTAQDLADQRGRFKSYASGKAPDSVTDAALELGVRGTANDAATFGGFGSRSSVNKKAQDLASYEKRLQLAEFGEKGISANIDQGARTLLSPTQYSDAGQQIRVTPAVDAGTRSAQARSEANTATVVPTTAALGSTTQQEQYRTNLEDSVRKFNAQGEFQESTFNAGAQNSFAENKFNYDAGYNNTLAGAEQNEINTRMALEQQQRYEDIAKKYYDDQQQSQRIGGLANGLTSILSLLGGSGSGGSGGGNILSNILGSLFGGGATGGSSIDPGFGGSSDPLSSILNSLGIGNSGAAGNGVSTPFDPSVVFGGQSGSGGAGIGASASGAIPIVAAIIGTYLVGKGIKDLISGDSGDPLSRIQTGITTGGLSEVARGGKSVVKKIKKFF